MQQLMWRGLPIPWLRRTLGAVACGMALLAGAAIAQGQDLQLVTRVEEDWVLEVGTPDPELGTPEIVNVLTPTGDLNSEYAVFELNHGSLHTYRAGGLQLQGWRGEQEQSVRESDTFNRLATPDETVSYTLAMRLTGGALQLEVLNGQSTTWGAFGSDEQLKLTLTTNLPTLVGYRPDNSVQHSRVNYAKHKVKRFTLHQVRYYVGDQLVATDEQERVVHEHSTTEGG